MPVYSIILTRRAERGLNRLSPALQRKALEFIDSYLKETPLRPWPGKIKWLRGSLSGTLQYDLSDDDRIWWQVDQVARLVTVTYIGPHPKETD